MTLWLIVSCLWQSSAMNLPKRPHQRVAVGRRRTGALTLGLFTGTALAALSLAYIFNLGATSTLIAVLLGGGAPAGLYLAWATYRDSEDGPNVDLSAVSDMFAAAVRDQWESEASARRLNDPYPLPVCWIAADEPLFDSWQDIEILATSGAGFSTHSSWARGPRDLEGEGNQLAEVLLRVPTRRLVVLGQPGSGKTILVIRLLLDLLQSRNSGDPVPVLVSAASWDPSTSALRDWLVSKLGIDYPALTASAPSGYLGQSCIEALINQHLITLIIDGLDEIPDRARGVAIARINDAMRPGEFLVVTSRTDRFRNSVKASTGEGVTLRGAAGVEICPLNPAASLRYLRSDASGSVGADRWAPVAEAIAANGPMAEILSNPLMVALARAIYNPRPTEQGSGVPNPATLCQYSSAAGLESHLLDGFVAASYRVALPGEHSWQAYRAEKWLTYLAAHLDSRIGSTDLAWWQLAQIMPRKLFTLIVGLLTGVICALAAAVAATSAITFNGTRLGLIFGGALGCFCACMSALVVRFRHPGQRQPSRGIRWKFIGGKLARRRVFGLLFGLAFGLIFGLSFGSAVGYAQYLIDSSSLYRNATSLATGITLGIAFAFVVGIVGVIAFSLEEISGNLSSGVSPAAALRRDRRATLLSAMGFSLFVTVALFITLPAILGTTEFLAAIAPDPQYLSTVDFRLAFESATSFSEPAGEVFRLQLAIGATVGLTAWLVFILSASESAWPSWLITRCWLAGQGLLPWRLMSFLADAHRRGVLRQDGAVYQFRHIELQRRLSEIAKTRRIGIDRPSFTSSPGGPTWRKRALLAAIAIVAAAVAGIGLLKVWQAGQPAPISVGVAGNARNAPLLYTCTGHAARRPISYMLACNSGNTLLSSVRWVTWDHLTATGLGELAQNTCVPACASGNYDKSSVLIILSKPVASADHGDYFSDMIVSGPSIFSYGYALGIYGANGNCPPTKICIDSAIDHVDRRGIDLATPVGPVQVPSHSGRRTENLHWPAAAVAASATSSNRQARPDHARLPVQTAGSAAIWRYPRCTSGGQPATSRPKYPADGPAGHRRRAPELAILRRSATAKSPASGSADSAICLNARAQTPPKCSLSVADHHGRR